MEKPKVLGTIFYFLLILVTALFIFTLFKINILGSKYYRLLSQNNLQNSRIIIAPRGVFFDRNHKLLTTNKPDDKHGYLRQYLYPTEYAHLLGYLGLPNKNNLKEYLCGLPPAPNQFVGQAGLEKFYECLLRGKNGEIISESNAQKTKTRLVAKNAAQPGQNIQLTVSTALQSTAQKAYAKLKGAVIASNPNTGEVYLFASFPSFNPDDLKIPERYRQLLTDQNKPLFNRLTLGVYPPGSVIKPFIGLAALEEGIINQDTEYEDTGIFKLGNNSFGNWYFLQYGKKEGKLNIVKAIARSNDIFFYQLGLKLGIDKLHDWLTKFTLLKNGLESAFVQNPSLLPDQAWKKETLHEDWYLGDTVNLSIGQGFLLVNPLELHQAASIIASSGKNCHLFFQKNAAPFCRKLNLHQENIDLIKQGMAKACETGGTAWPFFDFKVRGKKIKVACKTGTAESEHKNSEPHAWFTAFYPVEEPEIIITVFVENGGEGSNVAAPIAKQILEKYLSP